MTCRSPSDQLLQVELTAVLPVASDISILTGIKFVIVWPPRAIRNMAWVHASEIPLVAAFKTRLFLTPVTKRVNVTSRSPAFFCVGCASGVHCANGPETGVFFFYFVTPRGPPTGTHPL